MSTHRVMVAFEVEARSLEQAEDIIRQVVAPCKLDYRVKGWDVVESEEDEEDEDDESENT